MYVLERESRIFNFSRGGTCHGSSLVFCFLLSVTLFVFISLYVSTLASEDLQLIRRCLRSTMEVLFRAVEEALNV